MRFFNWCLIFLIVSPILLSKAFCQDNFEGTFTYEIALNKPNTPEPAKKNKVEFYVKGPKTLIQNQRENTSYNFKMLVENHMEQFYILLDRNQRKVAMKQDLRTIKKRSKESAQKSQDVKFRKTHETKEILGYQCTRYKVSQEAYTGQAWITDELSFEQHMESVFQVMKQHPKSKEGVAAVSTSNLPQEGVVVASSLEAKDSDRTINSRMKAIQEKDISNQRFDISQYQVMNIAGGQSFGE